MHGSALVSEKFHFTAFWKMHYDDQDVVVVYTMVKFVLRVFEGFEGIEGFESIDGFEGFVQFSFEL